MDSRKRQSVRKDTRLPGVNNQLGSTYGTPVTNFPWSTAPNSTENCEVPFQILSSFMKKDRKKQGLVWKGDSTIESPIIEMDHCNASLVDYSKFME